jgi:acyl carrier protein
MSEMKRESVLETISTLLVEVIGDDWAADIQIDEATSFNEDLELESIEFVALAERLQEVYGEEVNFVDWVGEMELDQIINLSVGDLVEFICSCHS